LLHYSYLQPSDNYYRYNYILILCNSINPLRNIPIHLFQQKLNIRCIPYDVLVLTWIMSDRQRDTVARLGFQSIFDLRTDALESRSLIRWFIDKTIRPGAGKEFKITKETVRLILGLPSAGGGRKFTDWYGEIDAATKLR
jgi:hypothetical protein